MLRCLVTVSAFLLLLASETSGQDMGSVRGIVVDSLSAVLPGVTVTATEVASGRQHTGVTDDRGEYRLPSVPAGTYDLRAELTGFGTVIISKVELLVGQNATFAIKMAVASVEETVTVLAQAPLVDTASSQVSGNVDRRQMEELPILGRNWMELALQVKGITANNIGDRPGVQRDDQFQLSLDGQQVTQKVSGSDRGQPKFSREAIAEFQIATTLFDVTDGRSMGIQVRAVTRAGTNAMQGAVYGNFRDDAFNAADSVVKTVLPYQNQQIGGAFGGPIVKDRAHYFGTYEYEREPSTIVAQPAQLPNQTFTYPTKLTQRSVLGRFDQVLSNRDHLAARVSAWDLTAPFELGSTAHPSQALSRTQKSFTIFGTWSNVLSNRALQEVKVGYNKFNWDIGLAFPLMSQTPQLVFPGLTIGGSRNYPQIFNELQTSARYDLTMKLSRHDLKIGGEFLWWRDTGVRELVSRGEFIFASRPADVERRFPAASAGNPAGWDLTGLDSTVQRYDLNVGDWSIDIPRPNWAIWLGDTWRASDRLTLNLGVRWDVDWGILDPPDMNSTATFNPVGGVVPQNSPPFASDTIALNAGDRVFKTGLRDMNNVAPRVGFAYRVLGTDDFVIRGGTGLFFTSPMSNIAYGQQSFNLERVLANTFPNDRLPGFIRDPLRGVTGADILAGRVATPPQQPRVIAHDYQLPYAWQGVIGFQKQLSTVMGLESDLVFTNEYKIDRARDINLFYDPATGYNRDLTTFGRPDPKYGQFQWQDSTGRSDYLGLSSGLTRRFRDSFQFNVSHTVMFHKHDNHQGTYSFTTFPDNSLNPDGDWARSSEFQRNTLRMSGLYHLPLGLNIAAAYFYGSGSYTGTTIAGLPFGKPGTNRLNVGAPITVRAEALRYFEGPSVIGTLQTTPRNALRGLPLHKVDLRLSKDLRIRHIRATMVAEVFNVLNHANVGTYNGQVNSPTFGEARQSVGNAYVPRSGQFGFKIAF
jgi:hypothetical protein